MVWFILVLLLFILGDVYLQKGGLLVSAIALVTSFGISRFYIKRGKELEELKTFSEQEVAIQRREYFIVYFAPYPLWLFMVIYFT